MGADISVDTRPGSIFVQPGDNLSKIAARFPEYGNANDLKNQFIAANPQLRDPNLLTEGMELNFPGAGTVVDRAAMARAVGADNRYQTALAARQQDYWDSLQAGAWSGRTGDGGPVWHVGGASAASTAGPLNVTEVVLPYDEFGLFSMPTGAAPIWNNVINPIAGVVGSIGPGMQQFKAGALNQLEYEGQLAVRAGDESALRSAAIRHTFVDLVLPGSPQELALGVAGGAVLGKATGMVSGSLSRAAAASTNFRFLNADIGEFAGAQIDNALGHVASVFRPNRLASDMSFEQTEALKNLTLTAYENLQLAGYSHKALSPAFTVAQDMVTGEVRFGLNNKLGDVPANLVDTLDTRLLNMPPEILASYIRTANAGSHSEIYAVNDLLVARPGAKLSEIAVSTIETGSPANARGLYKPACTHCEYILNGVHYVK